MSRRLVQERILERMVEAARAEPVPTIDFDRMQALLRQKWIGQRSVRLGYRMRWRWASAVGTAVAFLAGGWYGHTHRQALPTSGKAGHLTAQVLDARALTIGQEFVAGREPLVVDYPGVAHLTLAPLGKAKLLAKGQYLTVGLDAGHIDAEVVPSQQRESFAVEAGSLRIAVHGTAFSVERQADSVVVAVAKGTVVVGPAGHPGNTTGALIEAPRSERFSIMLRPDSSPEPVRNGAAVNPVVSRPKGAVLPAADPSVGPQEEIRAHPEDKLIDRPSRVEQEAALDVVRAAAARCFAQAKGGDIARDSRVLVRVDTQLTITIAPSGAVVDASFAPPVPDAILECTRHEVGDFTTSPSNLGSVASRPIMLTR